MGEENETSTSPVTSQVGNNDKKDKKKMGTILLVVLLVAALGAAGYFYWQGDKSKKQASAHEEEIASLQSALNACNDALAEAQTADEDAEGDAAEPIVIFSPGGLFTEAEKTEITTKMVNPLLAWNEDQNVNTVSVHIQDLSGIDGRAEYSVDVISEPELIESFLYGTIDDASLDWWTPTCLDACEFSDEFRAAYPEVVAASEGI